MALAEKGRRNGWQHQATGLVASHAALPATAKTAVDRGGALLNRRKASRPAGDGGAEALAQTIETGLARELDQARAEMGRQNRPFPPEGAAASLPQRSAASSAAGARSAEKAAQQLQIEVSAAVLQARAERLAAENAQLTRKLTERNSALDEARTRIKSLEEKLPKAAGEGAGKTTEKTTEKTAESIQNELRAARDGLQEKLDSVTKDNARLSRAATERDRALADARTRVEYLEAALAAAEAECGRQAGEAAKAREKYQAETSRASTAEKLLAEARERLLARIIEIDAVRQRVAQANAVADAAYDRQRQLEDAFCLQQNQFEELERSQSKLAEATKLLLQRFRDRERALVAANEKIKTLAERNAGLEAARDRTGSPQQRGREASHSKLEDAADVALQDWAELARLLGGFVERKAVTAPAAPRTRSARLIPPDPKARQPFYFCPSSSPTSPPFARHLLK
jgi:predicted nuclease with TOPRIM domain